MMRLLLLSVLHFANPSLKALSASAINSDGQISSVFEVIKSLQEELKSQREEYLSELKVLRQEAKSEWESERKNDGTVRDKLETVTNSLEDIRHLLLKAKPECHNATHSALKDGASANDRNASETSTTTVASSPNKTDGPATEKEGWTVIQNRDALPFRENFTRSWDDYAKGFGDLEGEFWIGLEIIHALTSSQPMELRVDLEDWVGVKHWANYGTFRVGDATTKFILRIGDYTGDAGDGMFAEGDKDLSTNGRRFSTYDRDNDRWKLNCAEHHHGGWWFNKCHFAYLNGLPIVGAHDETFGEGINWLPLREGSYSFKKASMKIRPTCRGQ